MKFTQNIKLRLTLWYLLILIILIIFFSAITYLMLALNIYHVSHPPSDVVKSFTVDIQNSSSSPEGNVNSNLPEQIGYIPLLNYDINKGEVGKIQSEANSFLQISVPEGRLTIDQKSYITADMSGEQEVSLFTARMQLKQALMRY